MFTIGATELIIVLVIALIVFAIVVGALKLVAGQRPQPPDPRTVLADRLARGEITKDEFDAAMRALGYPAAG